MKPKHAILYINLSLLFLSFSLMLLSLLNSPYLANLGIVIALIFILLLVWNFSFYKGICNRVGNIESDEVLLDPLLEENTEKLVHDEQALILKKIEKLDPSVSFMEQTEYKVGAIAQSIGLLAGLAYQLEQSELKLVYLYALERDNHKTTIQIGQGITGEVAKTGIPVTIDLLEDENKLENELNSEKDDKVEIHVFSGLGQSKPNYLHVLPIFNDKEIVGVVELATFQKWTPEKIDFLIEILKQ